MRKVKYGLLHCHTDNSIRDSVMTVKTLVSQAKKMGAPAVALTDHGVMTGYVQFMELCREEGIIPIVGVEAYVEEEAEGRRHLVLMAKDYTGFQALMKAVTESNTRVKKVGNLAFPRMNKEILSKHFSPGSKGHGHVIATSACVNGVLASVMTASTSAWKKAEELKEKQKQYDSPMSGGYMKNSEVLEQLKGMQESLTAEISSLKKGAQRSLLSLERKVLAAPEDTEKRRDAKAVLESAMREKKSAEGLLKRKKEEKEEIDLKITALKPILRQAEASIAKWEKIQSEIDKVLENYTTDEDMDDVLKQEACWYRDNFGKDDFYIELQYHGMKEEKSVMARLARLSDLTGIPVCLSNDAHIPEKTGNDILARAIIRTTRFDKWEEPAAADKELYLKSDEELISKISEILPKEKVAEGYENIGRIVSQCRLEIPVENHYPKFITPDGSSPEAYLRKKAYEGIPWRYPDGSFQEYDRLEQELAVICQMGYADYHCIVEDLLRYARAAGKLDLQDMAQEKLALSFDIEKIERFTRNQPGEPVGPGRGSAAGSLVCYLTGITNIDPLQYGLLFERFLNPERVSMPDIDCDIETNIRPYVIHYVKHKYGKDSVCGIMTRGRQTGKAAIQTAGRVYGIQKRNDATAFSDIVNDISRKAAEYAEDEQQINLKEIVDYLNGEFKGNMSAIEIIRYAALIEGSTTQIGQHAAGIIITDGKPVDEYVPLIYNGNTDIMMTQCDMTQAEDFHLLKIDFLGLNNLTIITETVRDIYKETGQAIDIERIPFDDPTVFSEIYACGMTNSVFQFESQGMNRMLRDFKPDTISDLILLVAMYRPGPMQYLPELIEIKKGKQPVRYLTPQLEPILKHTYGLIAYQEQVQEIFKQLAGYSLGQADLVRRAMSKKKGEILEDERQSFLYGDDRRNIPGCIRNQINESAASRLFDQMMEFAKYAFNKSHAACYAVVSYQTAWLKYHYPKEYMKAVLNHTAFEKIPGLVTDLRQMGITIKAPDVNRSELRFRIADGGILFGLGNIKGIGDSALGVVEERKKHGEYQSLQDFILRTQVTKKLLEGFIKSGALDCFYNNRKAMAEAVPEYLKQVKKLKGYQKKLAESYERTHIISCQKKIAEVEQKIKETKPDLDVCENELENLIMEKEILGVFASNHPMKLFSPAEKYGAVELLKALERPKHSMVTVIGMISDFHMHLRKKDGAEMGFFCLSDLTGEVEVCCFADAYVKFKDILREDAAIKIVGSIMYDRNDETKKKISAERAEVLRPAEKVITIYADLYLAGIDEEDAGLWNLLKPYVSQHGNPVRLYDTLMDEFRETDFLLSPAVLGDERIRATQHEA